MNHRSPKRKADPKPKPEPFPIDLNDPEEALANSMSRFIKDPEGFVRFIFPWGEAGSSLSGEDGPDKWQVDVLNAIKDQLHLGKGLKGAIKIAARSGHGVGKTALIAWIILWFMSTRPQPQIVVTANTSDQLSKKTWRELAKWHTLALNSHWFVWTATKFSYKKQSKTWFASAIPWSRERSEAFAGTHETHVLMIFDEGSAIDDVIWEVAEGAMTTANAMWVVFGNPTRNTGRFYECFHRYRHRWITFEIDGRKAKKTDKAQIQQWLEDYGEDSDFFRVRVKGQEPRAGLRQFIPTEIVSHALGRVINPDAYMNFPIIIGVDVADFGEDISVIYVRQGLATLKMSKHRPSASDKQWTMTFASLIVQEIEHFKADAVMVDSTGLGLGVSDRLIQLGYDQIVYKVYAGSSAADSKQWFNKRAEMWGKMAEWLKDGCIPDDNQLRDDLTNPEYGFSATEQIQLERKADMKDRGCASPDCGDALAMTFAFPINQKIRSLRDPVFPENPRKYSPWNILDSISV